MSEWIDSFTQGREWARRYQFSIMGGLCGIISIAHANMLAASEIYEPGRADILPFRLIMTIQLGLLVLWGGVATLLAVPRQRDGTTIDAAVPPSPAVLALRQVARAPALAYFGVLCLMPIAVLTAAFGGARPSLVIAGYLLLLLSGICVQSFALLVSVLTRRTWPLRAVLAVAFPIGLPVANLVWRLGQPPGYNVRALSPSFAVDLATEGTWAIDGTAMHSWKIPQGPTDVFFGWPVHHALVLALLCLIFAAWFLAPVIRSVGHDGTSSGLCTLGQALGFALTLAVLQFGFLRWGAPYPRFLLHNEVLSTNMALFYVLGIALLRDRSPLRQRSSGGSAQWVEALWPSPPVFAGMLLVGLAATLVLRTVPGPGLWNDGLALFRVAIFALWIARDTLYLQYLRTRVGRGGWGLTIAGATLAAFYLAAAQLSASFHLAENPAGLAVKTMLIPGAVLRVGARALAAHPLWWAGLAGMQLLAIALLAFLQRRQVGDLPRPAQPATAGNIL